MSTSRVFANAPEAVGLARRFVQAELVGVAREAAEAVAVMVSELATNCVRHTVEEFTVNVDRTRDQIRVEVTDRGTGVPTVRSPESSEPTGRGLRIVQELSDAFGVEELRDSPGKTVWFVVDLHTAGSERTEGENQLRA